MFDWFRKKKNVESQVAEDTALADNIEETHTTPETPESEADESPAADLPVSEAAAKELPEDTAGLADDLPPSEPPATVDDINDNAESKVPP